MNKSRLLSLVLLLLLTGCLFNRTWSPSEYATQLNKKFTGDLAYNTTSFVEKYWRVVGNTGFNKSIYKVAESLEQAGFVLEDSARLTDQLTYRIEKRPMKRPTWESVDASITINDEQEPLLMHSTNRNMIALNSYSTEEEGVTAEVMYITSLKALESIDVKGKIVFMETYPSQFFTKAVSEKGAVGILSYSNPEYLQPKKNSTSIQFRSIPLDSIHKSWAIALSYEAKERLLNRLATQKVILNVRVSTKIYPSEELTLVADIKGRQFPEQRLVVSAHVQEPGANDNASGVGVALEMATLTANLITEKQLSPQRTLTFLWGDEIRSTHRYIHEDSIRAQQIKWGISLDMVGEDTQKTGGVFLIEKMPDPSAIWTRGNDKHTEWGGSKLALKDMKPHYLNDYLLSVFEAQGALANWPVSSNPFEGGSDHVPFLRANIPGVLFWHFTDQFYHTDNDRIDKVSKTTLKNVGTAALVAIYSLINADENQAKEIITLLEKRASERLDEEFYQGTLALQRGEPIKEQLDILSAWEDWYLKAISSTFDLVENNDLISPAVVHNSILIQSKAAQLKKQLQEIDTYK